MKKFNLKLILKLFIFLLIYKLIMMYIISPLFVNVFDLLVNTAGYSYLTYDMLPAFFLNPVTIVGMLFILLIMALVTSIEFIGLYKIFINDKIEKNRINDQEKSQCDKCCKDGKLKWLSIILALLLIVLLMPIINPSILSGFISAGAFSTFAKNHMLTSKIFMPIFVVLLVFVSFILVKIINNKKGIFKKDVDLSKPKKRGRKSKKEKEELNRINNPIRRVSIYIFEMIIVWVVLIIIFIVELLFIQTVTEIKAIVSGAKLDSVKYIGHRGYLHKYPENTMLAFEKAVEGGADFLELDVQQLKDGTLIVLHDKNFLRTCGVDKNVWEVDYLEAKKYNAAYRYKDLESQPIPLFEDVLKFAVKNNIKLFIELKSNGHEQSLGEIVRMHVLLNKYENNCVIGSKNYDLVKNLKTGNYNITTAYIMDFAYNDMLQYDKVDGYNINAIFLNKQMIDRIHNEGKTVYSWGIDSISGAYQMVDIGVDNIITDDVNLFSKYFR